MPDKATLLFLLWGQEMPYRIDDDTPAACKTAKALLHNSSACLFVADVNGVIRWANRALLEWSHYTTKELEGIPWIDSSNEGVRQLLDGHVSIHSARRYLSPSSEKPVLCDVHLCRHPIAGDPLAILGTIQPIPSDATPALEEAMRAISEMRSVMAEHVGELRNLQESMRDEDATFIVATMRWCKRHPRVALVIFLMLLSAFGANNMLELAQRLYQIGVPVPEAVKQTDALQFPIAEPIAEIRP